MHANFHLKISQSATKPKLAKKNKGIKKPHNEIKGCIFGCTSHGLQAESMKAKANAMFIKRRIRARRVLSDFMVHRLLASNKLFFSASLKLS